MGKKKYLSIRNRANKRLTAAQKETVVQTYFMLGNKNATAKELGLNVATVDRIVRQAQDDPNLMAVRTRVMDETAGRIQDVTNRVIDSISDEELQTETHRIYDANGDLKRIVQSGPSLKDKAQIIGTLIDRQATLEASKAAIKNPLNLDAGQRALVLPDQIDAAKALIARKVKRLRIVDAEFETGEVGKRINMELNRHHISDKDVSDAVFEPFDG